VSGQNDQGLFTVFKLMFFREVDASSLAVFRIMFGALLLFESINYGLFLCLDCMYRDTQLLFNYPGFEWVTLPPGRGLELLFLIMGLAAFCVMVGYHYRLASIVMFLCFAYYFLLDRAQYLNHFYLALLFAAILIVVPANRCWSLDARRNPDWESDKIPIWPLRLIIAQLEITLVYAGLVKINVDWLQLEPMRMWMNARSQDEIALFQWLTQDWGIALASYGVIVLHLVGAPLLLWKKTRLFVFCIYVFFHTINAFVFDIGIFPFMTVAATLLLFSPAWPKELWQKWCAHKTAHRNNQTAQLTGFKGRSINTTTTVQLQVVSGIALWLLVQLLVPLRHLAYPGDVAWNEKGHQFSWRMMLRSKLGWSRFYVVEDSGVRTVLDPAKYLNARQIHHMACNPDLLWQFAQFLDNKYQLQGKGDVQIYVDTACSLNTREPAPLLNRLVDISAIDRNTPTAEWVTTLNKPLPRMIF
jgi:vitamin K-dependent gamma-carboxylase